MKVKEVKRCTNTGWKTEDNAVKDLVDLGKRVEDLMERTQAFVLVYVQKDGIPMTKTMSVKARDGIHKIWFVTHTSSKHAIRLLENPRATAYFTDNSAYESLTLVSNILEETDEVIRKKCWRSFYESGFPGGTNDPQYLVFRVEPEWGNLAYHDLNIDFTL